MRGCIVINAYARWQSAFTQAERIAEELQKLGAEVEILKNAPDFINADGSIERQKRYDFTVYLDKDRAIARMLEKSGERLFNSAQSIELCDDKMITYVALASHGVPMPKTLPAPLCYDKSAKPDARFLDRVEAALSYPLVAKQCYGSLGKEVYLVNNREELEKIESELMLSAHLYQEMIHESKGRDMRIVVVGKRVVAAMIRKNEHDFRSNIGAGGSGEALVPPQEYADLACRVAEILGLDYCGVDLLITQNGPVVCEVNSNAFFEGLERASGVNVAKAYAEHIIRSIG